MDEGKEIRILIPIFEDWEALGKLLLKFSSLNPTIVSRIAITIVNDGSQTPAPETIFKQTFPVELITLARNLGHQKAIAVGLASVESRHHPEFVVVMDGDGQDDPAIIPRLIAAAEKSGDAIVFAERTRRHEGIIFRMLYRLYRIFFWMMTGLNISFGNFSLVPGRQLSRLVRVSEIWNHFPGGIIRAKLPFIRIPVERGNRLSGNSKMSFSQLILYGLSAISVQIDQVSLRLLFFTFFLAFFGTAMTLFWVFRFALPAGESAGLIVLAGIILLVLLLLSVLLGLVLVFLVLSYRTQKLFIPARDFGDYILDIRAK